jgi:hypothetical protein
VKKWKSVHVTIAADHQLVAHPLAVHHHVLHRIDHPLAVHHHVHHQHQEMSVQPAVEDQIAQELHVKFPKVVKSAIHAGFVPPHKKEINREFVRESLNQIFLRMLLAKN